MAEYFRLKLRLGDMIAVAVVIALIFCAVIFVMPQSSGEGAEVCIYLEGELIETMPLDADGSFTVYGEYENVVTVLDGSVSISVSDCPGEDCVHSGSISAPGRSIVCLPNRVEVRINGVSETDEVDFVVG